MSHPIKQVLAVGSLLLTLAQPSFAQAPPAKINTSSLRYGFVRIELPSDQQLVVLGVSVYGDVRQLFPIAGKSPIAAAGNYQLDLDFGGPWLLGGEKQPAPPSLSSECMVDRSPTAGRTAMVSPNPTTPACGGSGLAVPAPLVTPMLSHLIVLGTSPSTTSPDLAQAVKGFVPKGKTAAIATALAERLATVSGGQSWWALGKSVVLHTAN